MLQASGSRVMTLSKIMSWYASDFGGSQEARDVIFLHSIAMWSLFCSRSLSSISLFAPAVRLRCDVTTQSVDNLLLCLFRCIVQNPIVLVAALPVQSLADQPHIRESCHRDDLSAISRWL
jgi:hypothetical protein